MPNDPWYIKLLERLGVNTTRMRWKLYQGEQRAKDLTHGGAPEGLKWMSYQHKTCLACGAVNDRAAKTCTSCEKPLPTMLGYRISRLARTIAPSDTPAVSMAFISIIVIAYVIQLAMDGIGFASLMNPSMEALYTLGAFSAQWAVGDQQYWRFLSMGLLHGGIIHFGFIVYALYQLGPLVEIQLDRRRMLALVTFTQIAAAYASFVWYYKVQGSPGTPTVGASGWLFGLIGYGIVCFHNMGRAGKPVRDSLLKWGLICLVFGFVVSGINNAGHIGGALAGMTFAFLPEGNVRTESKSNVVWQFLYIGCLLAWIATIFFMAKSLITVWPQLS